MIDDMAPLKQAMEQMDADDVAVSQAAKDRAAQILSDAKLSFSQMADLIERRRLLLRPKIVASIKRMDQPDMLGDAAFRDTGVSLRREGQSFRQIAEALELNGRTARGYEGPVPMSEPLHPMEMGSDPLHQMGTESEPGVPAWLRALSFVLRIVFYPLRHPFRFLVIALLVVMLFNSLRNFVGVGRQVSGRVADISAARQRADAAVSSVKSFVEKTIMRPSREAAAPPTSPAAIPSLSPADSPPAVSSADPATASAPSAIESGPSASAPSANQSTPSTPSPAASASPPTTVPPVSTPNPDARGIRSSKSAANDRPQVRSRDFEELMPEALRRKSRLAGPCIGGVGGCYWGGTRY
jgi:hypothetical protein